MSSLASELYLKPFNNASGTKPPGTPDLLGELDKQYLLIRDQLLDEESITLELDQQPWWGCLDGTSDHWGLQVVLQGNGLEGRGLEGAWPAPAAEAFWAALRTVWD